VGEALELSSYAPAWHETQCFRELRRWVEDFHAVPADGDIKAVVDSMTEHVIRLYSSDRFQEVISA
jgi:hypothetical protein